MLFHNKPDFWQQKTIFKRWEKKHLETLHIEEKSNIINLNSCSNGENPMIKSLNETERLGSLSQVLQPWAWCSAALANAWRLRREKILPQSEQSVTSSNQRWKTRSWPTEGSLKSNADWRTLCTMFVRKGNAFMRRFKTVKMLFKNSDFLHRN